jgi:hypothetical protein
LLRSAPLVKCTLMALVTSWAAPPDVKVFGRLRFM